MGRSRPSREGNILRGLAFPGEVGIDVVTGFPAGRRGDSDRACEGTGEAVLSAFAGDAGRAIREAAVIDGLAGLGAWAIRRVTPPGAIGRASVFPWELGPGTRRNRSSSCVLSFDDKGPTRDHTFSPTREYASLEYDIRNKLLKSKEKKLA